MAQGTEATIERAVIQTGGKQYLVTPGMSLKIEKILGEHKEGDTITFDQVLMHDDGTTTTLGKPTLPGKTVKATLVKSGRGRKITIIHYKSKVRHRKKMGHRQPFFEVTINEIA